MAIAWSQPWAGPPVLEMASPLMMEPELPAPRLNALYPPLPRTSMMGAYVGAPGKPGWLVPSIVHCFVRVGRGDPMTIVWGPVPIAKLMVWGPGCDAGVPAMIAARSVQVPTLVMHTPLLGGFCFGWSPALSTT